MIKWFILFLTFNTCLLNAQELENRFRLAAIVGFNASQIAGDDLAGFHKLGANVGLKNHYMFSEKVSLSMGLLFSQKGSKSNFNISKVAFQRKIALDYIDIPIEVHYHDKDKALFSAGLLVGRLVRYRQIVNDAPIHLIEASPYRDWAFGGIFGVTFFFVKNLGINLRYEYSFLSLGDQFLESNLRNLGQYGNVVSLRAMYFF